MKKALKITLIVVISIITVVIVYNEYTYTKSYGWENLEQSNKNIRFVDKLGYHYWFTDSFQISDGSVYILSSMSDRSWFKNYASIIKLDPTGKVLWETKTKIDRFKWIDFLPRVCRKQENPRESDIGIYAFSMWNNKIYALVFEDKGNKSEAQIWSFDLQGKLLDKKVVNYSLESDASIKIAMHNNSIYISKMGAQDKQIHLVKISCQEAKLVYDKIINADQSIPQVSDLAIDEADSSVAISVNDNKTEVFTIYKHTDQDDIKEHYKSEPLHRVEALDFVDGKLYIAERKDNELQVKDITHLHNPQVLLADKLNIKAGVSDLLIKGNSVFIGLMYGTENKNVKKNTNIQPLNLEVMVRQYSLNGKYTDYSLQGKSTEMFGNMYIMPDNQLLVLGYSFSTSYKKCMRVFATLFKL